MKYNYNYYSVDGHVDTLYNRDTSVGPSSVHIRERGGATLYNSTYLVLIYYVCL